MRLRDLYNNLRTYRSWSKNAPRAKMKVKVGDNLHSIESVVISGDSKQVTLMCTADAVEEVEEEDEPTPAEKIHAAKEEILEQTDLIADLVREHEPEPEIETYDESITVGVVVNIALFARFMANAPLSDTVVDALRELAKSDDVIDLMNTIKTLRNVQDLKAAA